ncbi:MAG: Uma2 family endonuclease [Myxococcaceae bacterium]
MIEADRYNEIVPVPRGGVSFPLELRPPPGFRVDDPATWPRAPGRLEFVGGRLLFMPPCGDDQQDVSASVMGVLEPWSADHPEFVVGGNEAGMLLAGEVRGADGAVWRRDALGSRRGGYRRVSPLLVAEVAGEDEGEEVLRAKARWYFEHGVKVVWLVLPQPREVLVLQPEGESRHRSGERLPAHPELPGLAPEVDRLFRQLGAH